MNGDHVLPLTFGPDERRTQMHSTRRPSGYVKPSGWTSTIVPRILRRDHGICYLCGKAGANSVDHKTPVSQGGTHHDHNLGAVHDHPCHAIKTEVERRAALKARQRRRPVKPNPNVIEDVKGGG